MTILAHHHIHLKEDWTAYAGRGIVALWLLFWVWFAVASGVFDRMPWRIIALHVAVPALFFGLLAYLAWKREFAAGAVLIALGLASAALYRYAGPGRMSDQALLMALLAFIAPPLVAGTLLLLHGRSR